MLSLFPGSVVESVDDMVPELYSMGRYFLVGGSSTIPLFYFIFLINNEEPSLSR